MVSDPDGPTIAFYLLLLLLPLSALFARRLPGKQVAIMVLAWAGIFVGLLLLGASGVVGALTKRWDSTHVSGTTARVPASPGGHYIATVRINGVERRMLIDTGATTTALSQGTARAAGIAVATGGFPVLIDTANGMIEARRAVADSVQIDELRMTKLPVIVSDSFGDTDVIGMNFLSRLDKWRVEANELVLTP